MIVDYTFSLTTDGSGDATETGSSHTVGRVVAVAYDFTGLDATADTTIEFVNSSSGVDRTVVVYTDNNGSGFDDIVDDAVDAAGAASGTDVHPFVDGDCKVTIAQGGTSNTATVKVYVDVNKYD